MKDKETKVKAKKPIFKKWWFWVIIIVILAAIFGNTDDTTEPANTNPPTTESTQSSEQETESQSKALSILIEGGCRALTENFVEGVVEEDYSMLAFNVEEFELDENENGTIKVLYLPSNVGEEGATKVNLTISKNGGTYKIEYAMLSGLYEVDLEGVSKEYTELITE